MLIRSNRLHFTHSAELLKSNIRKLLAEQYAQLSSKPDALRKLLPGITECKVSDINHLQIRLSLGCGQMLGNSLHKQDLISQTILFVHPSKVLKHGYSNTRLNGASLCDTSARNKGNRTETQLANGRIQSSMIKAKE
jgi:exonuclease VII large subunit